MAGEKGNVFPIRRKDLEEHFIKVDEAMKYINRGGNERLSLFDLVRDIGTGTKDLMEENVQKIIHIYRDGFALYYQIDAMIGDRAKRIDGNVTDQERDNFSHSYATFASSSWINHRLGLVSENKEPFPFEVGSNIKFDFGLQRDMLLNIILARLYGVINIHKRNKNFDEGNDLARGTYNYFKFVKDNALAHKTNLNHSLVELVDKTSFVIADEYTLTGFESSFEEKTAPKIEFVHVEPHEVIGCALAKKEMLRDMDRIALYDPILRKNPIIEVGGLSPSVLYDGFPGTGKTTLFRAGRTRLKVRADAVNEYWVTKNIKPLPVKLLEITPKVKTKWYGEAGQNTSQLIEEAQRPDSFNLLLTDDIDMLFSGGREESGGGDKDIMNIFMQFASGVNTKYEGFWQWWAATNEPTALDPAMRQRFISKYDVAGPETDLDFSDILYLKLGKWINSGLVSIDVGKGYVPLKERVSNGNNSNRGEGIISRVAKRFSSYPTLQDLGIMAKKFKDENPRFTGRPIQAVAEAIAKRINDYPIPEEWYTEPKRFFEKTFEERVGLLKDLCKKVDSNVIAEELERYANIESRYASEKFEKDVERQEHVMKVDLETKKRLIKELGKKDDK